MLMICEGEDDWSMSRISWNPEFARLMTVGVARRLGFPVNGGLCCSAIGLFMEDANNTSPEGSSVDNTCIFGPYPRAVVDL